MTHELYKNISTANRWLITIVVMSATLMQVIDSTIVNVALPRMQGALAASPDEITWTLTSYLVSAAIFMPLTGYFSDRFGTRKYLFISIAGFTLTSALCGAANSLNEIVIFRLLQGIFGAGLVPLAQAILVSIFPPEERSKAMAIWGMAVMVGPILGPSLGGYLTEVTTWRWIFYVNIPVGIAALLFMHIIPNTAAKTRHMDWKGLFCLSLAIGGLQYVSDRGNSADWFNADSICIISYLSLVGFISFLLHSLSKPAQAVFDIRIFKDLNFSIASIVLCLFCLGLYGMMVLQPMMMESLLNYPVLTAGLILAPRGISGMISMIIVSKLIKWIESRWLIIAGILLSIAGTYIGTQYSLENVDMFWLIWPMILQGFGLGLIFVPLSTLAFSSLPSRSHTEAAGLYSLLRTIGGSIGISITITLMTRHTQFYWNKLSGFVTLFNPALYQYLHPLQLDPTQSLAANVLGHEVARQAQMQAYISVYAFIMWCFVLMLPLVLMIRPSQVTATVAIQVD